MALIRVTEKEEDIATSNSSGEENACCGVEDVRFGSEGEICNKDLALTPI